jgi:hypothetical protein
MGSRKFCMFLMVASVFSTTFDIIVAQSLFENGLKYSGPYPLLGAGLCLFYLFTPRLHPKFFGALGFHFSEKSIQYAFALQAAAWGGWATIVPTMNGLLAGYLATISPFNKFDLPDAVVSIVASVGERVVDSPPGVVAPRAPRVARAAQPQPVFQPPPAPPSPPPESAIQQLTSMGFEREAVIQALQQSQNNVERAADRLLSG